MKQTMLFLTLLLCSNQLFAQYNSHYSLLNGFEDSTGTTHLTFAFSTTDSINVAWPDCSPYYLTYVDVIHFNTKNLQDSVLVSNNAQPGFCGPATRYFSDIKAIDNDPGNFVVSGSYGDGFEPYGYLHFLSTGAQIYPLFSGFDEIYLDPSRPDTIFINQFSEERPVLALPKTITQEHLELISYGSYDVPDDTARKYFNFYKGFSLVGFSPFSDSVLFGGNSEGLIKSENRGASYSVVDETKGNYKISDLYFDADSQHIYLPISGTFLVSDNFGEKDSWVEKEHPFEKEYDFETDPAFSGMLYTWSPDSNEVFISLDYGSTFKSFLAFENNITGLYKKPNSDILYVLTKDELFEVNTSTLETTSLKKIPVANEDEPKEIPSSITLHQNYPNPFNPSTTISFELDKPANVTLTVFDALGRTISTLVNERKSTGIHQVNFDASTLSSGIYFYRLEAREFSETKRLTLIK